MAILGKIKWLLVAAYEGGAVSVNDVTASAETIRSAELAADLNKNPAVYQGINADDALAALKKQIAEVTGK